MDDCEIADARAHAVADEDRAGGGLFPRVQGLRSVTGAVAEAVVRAARDAGVGRPLTDEQIPEAIAAAREPRYLPHEAA